MADPDNPAADTHNPWRSFAKTLGSAGVALLIAQILGFFSAVYVAGRLGPQEYGRVGLALSLFSTTGYLFVFWGTDPLATRRMASSDSATQIAVLGALRTQRLAACALALLAGVMAALLWRDPSERWLVLLGVADGAIIALTVPAAFDVLRRNTAYFSIVALRQAVYLAAVLIAFAAMGESVGPTTVLALHAAGMAVQVAIEWAWVRRSYGAIPWSRTGPAAKQLWIDAVPVAVATVALQILGAIGPPSIEFLSDEAQLGTIVLSNQLATVVCSFLSIPASMIHARLAAMPDPTGPAFLRRVCGIAAVFTLLGVGVSVVFSALSPWMIGLLFPKFTGAAEIFAIDVWRAVGVMASAVLGSALICQNRTRAFGVCHVLALAVGVVIVAVFVPERGASAAVAAVVAGRFAFAVFAAVALMKRST